MADGYQSLTDKEKQTLRLIQRERLVDEHLVGPEETLRSFVRPAHDLDRGLDAIHDLRGVSDAESSTTFSSCCAVCIPADYTSVHEREADARPSSVSVGGEHILLMVLAVAKSSLSDLQQKPYDLTAEQRSGSLEASLAGADDALSDLR